MIQTVHLVPVGTSNCFYYYYYYYIILFYRSRVFQIYGCGIEFSFLNVFDWIQFYEMDLVWEKENDQRISKWMIWE